MALSCAAALAAPDSSHHAAAARYPAGVDPNACPNYPYCNPAVSHGALTGGHGGRGSSGEVQSRALRYHQQVPAGVQYQQQPQYYQQPQQIHHSFAQNHLSYQPQQQVHSRPQQFSVS